jgi:hypothetical protein
MRRYFFQICSQRGTDDDPEGIVLSGHSAAMLHAVTMCAEVGCNGGFHLDFAVRIRDELGAEIGRVSVLMVTTILERRDV